MNLMRQCFFLWTMKLVIVVSILIFFPSKTFQSNVNTWKLIERNRFYVQFREEIISYSVMGVFVLPGEALPIRAWRCESQGNFTIKAESGRITEFGMNNWIWQAPKLPGLYPVLVINQNNLDTLTLNVFVKVPRQKIRNGYLNGYRVGYYPRKSYKNLSDYLPPAGFIEVTKENEETWISPHFQLKQFVCKGGGDYPKYLVLKEKLILKLENIIQSLHLKGFDSQNLNILSGYRTPYYNNVIGNVKYSRHIYGDAADIFIDTRPKDGIMDDLNMDAHIDFQDAKMLFEHIDILSMDRDFRFFEGGLGVYDKTGFHGPFVHIDVRGYRARWGYDGG